jgi:hypothetical protein
MQWWGFAPSFSAHVRWGERGAPVLFLSRLFLTVVTVELAFAESHISRKTSEIPGCTGNPGIWDPPSLHKKSLEI